MKTRWTFRYEAEEVAFEEAYRFGGKLTPTEASASTSEPVEFHLEITPDEVSKRPGLASTGRMDITLSGGPETTEELAYTIALQVRERVCLEHGRMDILDGLLAAERLPETDEERRLVGDAPHWLRLSVRRVQDVPRFNPDLLAKMRTSPRTGRLVQMFNAARTLERPTDRYLSLFKVLEKSFADKRGGKVLSALRDSDKLFRLVESLLKAEPGVGDSMSRVAFAELLQELVRIRDNCAHLRGRTGYLPGDPRIASEVVPRLAFLERLLRKYLVDEVVEQA